MILKWSCITEFSPICDIATILSVDNPEAWNPKGSRHIKKQSDPPPSPNNSTTVQDSSQVVKPLSRQNQHQLGCFAVPSGDGFLNGGMSNAGLIVSLSLHCHLFLSSPTLRDKSEAHFETSLAAAAITNGSHWRKLGKLEAHCWHGKTCTWQDHIWKFMNNWNKVPTNRNLGNERYCHKVQLQVVVYTVHRTRQYMAEYDFNAVALVLVCSISPLVLVQCSSGTLAGQSVAQEYWCYLWCTNQSSQLPSHQNGPSHIFDSRFGISPCQHIHFQIITLISLMLTIIIISIMTMKIAIFATVIIPFHIFCIAKVIMITMIRM